MQRGVGLFTLHVQRELTRRNHACWLLVRWPGPIEPNGPISQSAAVQHQVPARELVHSKFGFAMAGADRSGLTTEKNPVLTAF